MTRRQNLLLIFVGSIVVVGILAFALWKKEQSLALLPAGTGKEEVIKNCTTCHNAERIVYAKPRDVEGWNNTIKWMQKMQGMGAIAEADRQKIVVYLSNYFGPEPNESSGKNKSGREAFTE